MTILSEDALQRAMDTINEHGRPLERVRLRHAFHDEDAQAVIEELRYFQNDNGGFGNALEPDFRLPDSSAIATSIAFQILESLEDDDGEQGIISTAIRYLEETYDEERGGWFAVPESVNHFPHAPWWHYDYEKGGTVIDDYWGNPSAELAGHLYKHSDETTRIDVDDLVNRAVDHIDSLLTFESPHEIYCYIRLYHLLPAGLSKRMEDQITEGVQQLVEEDPEEWAKYTSQPLHFVKDKDSFHFGIPEYLIERNLEYLLDILENNGKIESNWKWGSYQDEWRVARREWVGVLTLRVLTTLRRFDRVL